MNPLSERLNRFLGDLDVRRQAKEGYQYLRIILEQMGDNYYLYILRELLRSGKEIQYEEVRGSVFFPVLRLETSEPEDQQEIGLRQKDIGCRWLHIPEKESQHDIVLREQRVVPDEGGVFILGRNLRPDELAVRLKTYENNTALVQIDRPLSRKEFANLTAGSQLDLEFEAEKFQVTVY